MIENVLDNGINILQFFSDFHGKRGLVNIFTFILLK